MTKLTRGIIIDSIEQANIWNDEWDDEMERRADEYWDMAYNGDMSWKWYMNLKQNKDWSTVVINSIHKNITVVNWLAQEYPEAKFEYERNHFLIEEHDVAMMVALKWT